VLANTILTGRIRHLKRLEEKWAAELRQLSPDHADQWLHFAEALDDLRTMIRRLEDTISLEAEAETALSDGERDAFTSEQVGRSF
jgi:hypothetical protein